MVTQSKSATHSHDATIHRTPTAKHLAYPLMAVVNWEWRRIWASRASWIIALLVFAVSLVLIRTSRQFVDINAAEGGAAPGTIVHSLTTTIPWTTLVGLTVLLPSPALIFALILPFVSTDGVALDLKRRTHELVMTSALPTWAYVWGRYLASLLLSVGLAAVFLLAIVAVALEQHVARPAAFPVLNLPGTIAVWGVVVLPTTVLLSSLSFALGTLLPQFTNLVKVGVLFGWFVCGVLLPDYLTHVAQQTAGFSTTGQPPSWYIPYMTWDPTSVAGGEYFGLHMYYAQLFPLLGNANLSNQAILQHALGLEHQLPDFSPLIGPHLAWAALGVATVAAVTLLFRRFQNVLG
jgi:ABC-type transport system involved in multi-copper enzyme maturation permease subunit